MHYLIDVFFAGLALFCWTGAREYRKLSEWQETRTDYWYQQCLKAQDALCKERNQRGRAEKIQATDLKPTIEGYKNLLRAAPPWKGRRQNKKKRPR